MPCSGAHNAERMSSMYGGVLTDQSTVRYLNLDYHEHSTNQLTETRDWKIFLFSAFDAIKFIVVCEHVPSFGERNREVFESI